MLSRRGLFGFMAGVAAAAPVAAESLKSQAKRARFHSGGIVNIPKRDLPLYGEFPSPYPPQIISGSFNIDRVLVNGIDVNACDWALAIDLEGNITGVIRRDHEEFVIAGCA